MDSDALEEIQMGGGGVFPVHIEQHNRRTCQLDTKSIRVDLNFLKSYLSCFYGYIFSLLVAVSEMVHVCQDGLSI